LRVCVIILKRSKPEPALWLAGKSGNPIMKATEILQKKGLMVQGKMPSNETD
jgi:hypothetical protein